MPAMTLIRAGVIKPAGGTLLLDTGIASAANAYSTRKLRTAYAGSAIRIRRSSDDTEQDIGFSGENLNTAAISSFVGANNAFIVTWYDQAGSDDITQSDTTKQPRIVSSGTIDVANTKPVLYLDGSDDFLKKTGITTLAGATQFTGSAVALKRSGGDNARLISINDSFGQQDWSGTDRVILIGQSGGGSNITSTRNGGERATGATTSNVLFTAVSFYDATNHNLSIDGGAPTTSAFTAEALDATSVNLRVGIYSDETGSAWPGSVGEVILWASALSGGDRTTLQSNQETYWGTP
jgi:hypothetical protein